MFLRHCLDAPIRSICVSFGLELAETAAGLGAALLSTTAQELRRRRRSSNLTAGVGHGPATRRRPGRRSERLGLGQCAAPSGRHKRCQCREATSRSWTRRALPAGGLAGTTWPCRYDTAATRRDVSPAGNRVPARAVLLALPGRAGPVPRPGGASSRRPATACRCGRSCRHFLGGLVWDRGQEVRQSCGRPRATSLRVGPGHGPGAGRLVKLWARGARASRRARGGTDLALDPASLEQVQPNLAAAGPGLGTGAIGLGAPPKGRGNRADGKVTRRVFNVRFPCNPHPAKSCCGTPCSSNFSSPAAVCVARSTPCPTLCSLLRSAGDPAFPVWLFRTGPAGRLFSRRPPLGGGDVLAPRRYFRVASAPGPGGARLA